MQGGEWPSSSVDPRERILRIDPRERILQIDPRREGIKQIDPREWIERIDPLRERRTFESVLGCRPDTQPRRHQPALPIIVQPTLAQALYSSKAKCTACSTASPASPRLALGTPMQPASEFFFEGRVLLNILHRTIVLPQVENSTGSQQSNYCFQLLNWPADHGDSVGLADDSS